VLFAAAFVAMRKAFIKNSGAKLNSFELKLEKNYNKFTGPKWLV